MSIPTDKKKKNELPTDKKELNELLKALGDFPKIPLVRQLKKKFESQIKIIESKEAKDEKLEERRVTRLSRANESRSGKTRRMWNYVKQIKKNYYPDKSFLWIRRELKKFKENRATEIAEEIWDNPSP
ncbi:MAG: hypothetical protein EX285_04615 [Thaumarchaeota archaeon]|nr:hypothetical protein [Nitrososphaerota archaeon]